MQEKALKIDVIFHANKKYSAVQLYEIILQGQKEQLQETKFLIFNYC